MNINIMPKFYAKKREKFYSVKMRDSICISMLVNNNCNKSATKVAMQTISHEEKFTIAENQEKPVYIKR